MEKLLVSPSPHLHTKTSTKSFIGAVVAIGVAKMTFGGLGQNLFNPAIVGRVFLLISFPTYMTDWTRPQGFIGGGIDALSGATPLGAVKEGGIAAITGGLLLGAIFMATDYVTSPMSNVGGIIFGVGIGIITMLIRYFGAYPEGMSFAILIMNSVVPLINKWCHSKKYGR